MSIQPRSRLQLALLACGLAGGFFFMVSYSLAGAFTPGYRWLYDTISSLETYRTDNWQQANFILFGLLNILFAIGLAREVKWGFSGTTIFICQLLSGIALIGDGFFIHNPMHMVFDLVTFNASLLTLLFFTGQFYKNSQWRGWIAYSICTAMLMMAFLTVFGMSLYNGGRAGLFERLAVLPRTIWSVTLVIQLLRGRRFDKSSPVH